MSNIKKSLRRHPTFNPDRNYSYYLYEPELKKMDIEEFIEFCIRNQRYIIRKLRTEKKQEVEVL